MTNLSDKPSFLTPIRHCSDTVIGCDPRYGADHTDYVPDYIDGKHGPNFAPPAMRIVVAQGYDTPNGDYVMVANLTQGNATYYWSEASSV